LIRSKTRIFVAYGRSIFSSKYTCVNLQTTYGIITENPPNTAIQRFEDIALKIKRIKKEEKRKKKKRFWR